MPGQAPHPLFRAGETWVPLRRVLKVTGEDDGDGLQVLLGVDRAFKQLYIDPEARDDFLDSWERYERSRYGVTPKPNLRELEDET